MKKSKYTQEQLDFVRQCCKRKMTSNEIVVAFNEKFERQVTHTKVRSIMSNHKIRNGVDKTFIKGHKIRNGHQFVKNDPRGIPYRFKKGHKSHNELPLGTERNRNGYTHVKTEKGFITKQQYIWEQSNGELPKGKRLIFLNGDRNDFELDNIYAVDQTIMPLINKMGLIKDDREVTKAGITLAMLKQKRYKSERRLRESKTQNDRA